MNIDDYLKASDESLAKRQEKKKQLYGNESDKDRFIKVLKADFDRRKPVWVDSAEKIIEDQNRINECINADKDLGEIKDINFIKPE